MHYEILATLVGSLLIFMALTRSFIDRIPFSGAMVYILVGLAVSPLWLQLAHFDLPSSAQLFERGTEAVVLVSLFTAGLKLSAGLGDRRWLLPVRLATISMLVTVAGITLVGWWLLDLPLGAAVLLGGILAPTDPVLASDVQVNNAADRDRLRFALTGEGGLNDGTAFPVVMLGLGLLGLHELGAGGWRWFAVDVLWSTSAGIVIGAAFGLAVGRLVLRLRLEHKAAVGVDDFLSMGLVATAYGVAMLCHGSGFLAVFAAGFALRRTERRASKAADQHATQERDGSAPALADNPQTPPSGAPKDERPAELDTQPAVNVADGYPAKAHLAATGARTAPGYMAHAVLTFNEQLERVGEAAIVIAVGAVLWAVEWQHAVWWFIPLLFLCIRPLSVAVGLVGSDSLRGQRRLVAWFGIRGIGSVYYLAYAQVHGLPEQLQPQLTAIVLSVVAASIVLHGASVTPLMARYQQWMGSGSK